MNLDCSDLLDMRNLQEQVKKAFCYQKFENSLPSASNFKSFSETLDQSFLTVGQSNFGNKIPFLWGNVERDRPVQWIQLSCTRIVKMHIKIVNYYCWCPWNWTEYKIYSELHLVWKKYQLDHKLALFLLRIFFLSL